MHEFLQKNRFVFSLSLIFLLAGIAISIWVRTWSINAQINANSENQNLVDVINQLEDRKSVV